MAKTKSSGKKAVKREANSSQELVGAFYDWIAKSRTEPDMLHSRGFEEYLALVDQYYAEDVEVSTDVSPDPLVGKQRLKSLLLGFLVPLHMMAEMGGLWVSIQEAPIPGDSLDEQHSEWSLELIGVTGRRVTQTWCARRRWKQSRVVSEYHYAHQQDGEALSFDDLRIAAPSDPDTVKPS